LLLILDQVSQGHTAVSPALVMGDNAGFEELHKSGARHSKKVGRLLSREKHSIRRNRHSVAVGESVCNLLERTENLIRDESLISIRSDQGSLAVVDREVSLYLPDSPGKVNDVLAYPRWIIVTTFSATNMTSE